MKNIIMLMSIALGFYQQVHAETITYNCASETQRFQFTVSDEDYSLMSLEYTKDNQSYIADIKTIDMNTLSLWNSIVIFDIAFVNLDENMRLFVRFPKVDSNGLPIEKHISITGPHFDRFRHSKLISPPNPTVPTAFAALMPAKSKSLYLESFICTIFLK